MNLFSTGSCSERIPERAPFSILRFIRFYTLPRVCRKTGATGNPASGVRPEHIGPEETEGTALGFSLQLTGSGQSYHDFHWIGPVPHTRGAVNKGQVRLFSFFHFFLFGLQRVFQRCPRRWSLRGFPAYRSRACLRLLRYSPPSTPPL